MPVSSAISDWRWGFFSAVFNAYPLAYVLRYAREHAIAHLELGTGGYPGAIHCPLERLLTTPKAYRRWLQQLQDAGVQATALSCHGNPLHPDPLRAAADDHTLRRTIALASRLGIETVVTFSGVGGAPATAAVPQQLNWPVVSWPYENSDYYHWVWETRLIPYWLSIARLAAESGVRIALEMHGGFLVHSPGTLLQLRQACGPAIGANLDPSHFWWQGMDPVRAIPLLGEALFHVHLKDWRADPEQQAMWGLLDPRDERSGSRSWSYCLPGQGHDAEFWRSFLAALQQSAYRGMLSLEHEASTVSAEAGVGPTLRWLQDLLPTSTPPDRYESQA
jgi:sugar phosphate isomerase/epimerase